MAMTETSGVQSISRRPGEVNGLISAACLFHGFSDPSRIAILQHLALGEHRVVELTAHLGLAQSTVSKHLKTLREFQIVTVREQGQHRYYRLEPASLEPVAEWVGAFLRPAVAASEPVSDEVADVAAMAPAHPLPPRARGAAVRLGSAAASVVGLLRR